DGVQLNVDHAMDGLRASLGRLGIRVDQAAQPATATPVPHETAGGARVPERLAADVLGWQEVVLNQELPCAQCGRTQPRGARALLAITTDDRERTFICMSCAPNDAESSQPAIAQGSKERSHDAG